MNNPTIVCIVRFKDRDEVRFFAPRSNVVKRVLPCAVVPVSPHSFSFVHGNYSDPIELCCLYYSSVPKHRDQRRTDVEAVTGISILISLLHVQPTPYPLNMPSRARRLFRSQFRILAKPQGESNPDPSGGSRRYGMENRRDPESLLTKGQAAETFAT